MVLKIIIAIIVIAISLFLIYIGLVYCHILLLRFLCSRWEGMKPNTPAESVNEISYFLGMKLGDDYEIIEHHSQNNHGDRPLSIRIILSEIEFEKVMLFLNEITLGVVKTYSKNKETLYSETWSKNDTHYYKSASNSHMDNAEVKYTFFVAELSIDLVSRIISYKEYGL